MLPFRVTSDIKVIVIRIVDLVILGIREASKRHDDKKPIVVAKQHNHIL